MMTLLGQHGQPMDYERGIKLISYSAQTADENAPQGAYVRLICSGSCGGTDRCDRFSVCCKLTNWLRSIYPRTFCH